MKKILFVCLGNICRSPAAEAVFKYHVQKNNLLDFFIIDSAGTASYHEGSHADRRMIERASLRDIKVTSIARQLQQSDLDKFDLIITMDDSNHNNVLKLCKSEIHRKKVKKMIEYSPIRRLKEIPDPYYGNHKDFDQVLDLLDDACCKLLEYLQQDK